MLSTFVHSFFRSTEIVRTIRDRGAEDVYRFFHTTASELSVYPLATQRVHSMDKPDSERGEKQSPETEKPPTPLPTHPPSQFHPPPLAHDLLHPSLHPFHSHLSRQPLAFTRQVFRLLQLLSITPHPPLPTPLPPTTHPSLQLRAKLHTGRNQFGAHFPHVNQS